MNKKNYLRIIAAILCVCLVVPAVLSVGAAEPTGYNTVADENGCYTNCKGNCEHAPSIIIHGIGQSTTYLADENGSPVYDSKGDMITGWPLYIDADYAIKELIFPLILSLFCQKDMGLSEKAKKVVPELFKWITFDENGDSVYNIVVKNYPYSVARCSEEEKKEIYDHVPLQVYSQAAGEDHLYYFAYNSFGNNMDICAELHAFIEQVKTETGHDKVNIVPISLGGTIMNGLLEYYPDTYKDLNRVLYIVPALDGSALVGDLFKGKFNTDPKAIYGYLIPSLTGDKVTGNLINIALRIFPYDVIKGLLDAIVESLIGDVLVNCTTMWSLVPQADFEEARDKWHYNPLDCKICEEIELYHRAQCNSLKNIQKLVDNGVEVFNIVDYSSPMYCLVPSWNEYNSDGIIHLSSTSMGMDSCLIGQKYPNSYVQKNVNKLGGSNCSDPTHNHISPDREIDASTALLPDHSFYFYKQNHESTGSNDVIMLLATALLKDNSIKDVYSDSSFPQFNVGRDGRKIKNLLNDAKKVDQSALTAEQAAILNKAIAQAEAYLADTVVVEGKEAEIKAQLENALVAVGYREPPEDKTAYNKLGDALEKLNDLLNKTMGYQGFTD